MDKLSEQELTEMIIPLELREQLRFGMIYTTSLAVVYMGENKTTRQKKIFKFLNPASELYKINPTMAQDIVLRQAKNLQAMKSCPYIAQIEDVFENSEDKKTGFSLSHYSSISKFKRGISTSSLTDFTNLKKFLMEVLQGLSFAEKNLKLYHLHLTPECIGYCDKKQVFMVADWERAVKIAEQKDEINISDAGYNSEVDQGIILEMISKEVVFPNYFSPEVKSCASKKLIQIQDLSKVAVFSLALIVLEIFGVNPKDWSFIYQYKDENEDDTALFNFFESLDFPVQLSGLLKQMLKKDPRRRPSNEEIIAIIQGLQGHELEMPHEKWAESLPQELNKTLKRLRQNLFDKLNHTAVKSMEERLNSLSNNYCYIKSEDSYYRGVFQGDQREGFGEKYFAAENFYCVGAFKNDRQNGVGVKIDSAGNIYSGMWENGQLEGNGRIYFAESKEKYKGSLRNSLPNGEGALYMSDGTVYKTTWINGKKHGKGVIIKDGFETEAEWKDDKLVDSDKKTKVSSQSKENSELNSMNQIESIQESEQAAVVKDKSASTNLEEKKTDSKNQKTSIRIIQEGVSNISLNQEKSENETLLTKNAYEDHAREAKQFFHQNSDTYVGEWKDEKWHGKGLWESGKNISQYEGSYVFGKREGTGIMHYENGDVYEGRWKEGQKNGEGKYIWKNDNSIYEGEWLNDKREGYGVMKYGNKDEYIGDWKADYFEGKGTYSWVDGRKYVGDFKKGLFEGEGKMEYSDGDYYKGEWKNDVYFGIGEYYSSEEQKIYSIKNDEDLSEENVFSGNDVQTESRNPV